MASRSVRDMRIRNAHCARSGHTHFHMQIVLLKAALRRGRSPSLPSTSGRRSSSATTACSRGYVATVVEMLWCEACRKHEDGITGMKNFSKACPVTRRQATSTTTLPASNTVWLWYEYMLMQFSWIIITSECKSLWGKPERVHRISAVNIEDECTV